MTKRRSTYIRPAMTPGDRLLIVLALCCAAAGLAAILWDVIL